MKLNQSPLLLTILILLNCLSLVCLVYSSCSTGKYLTSSNDPIDEMCEDCEYGGYCPGDDHWYKCPPGTITPKAGMSSCVSCNGARVSSGATMCLLEDTPMDAQEIYPKYSRKTLNYKPKDKQTYLFIGEETKYFNKWKALKYTFEKFIHISIRVPLVIYASSVTGQPNESNYQWTTSGTFSELIIPIESIVIPNNNSFVQISITLIYTPDNSLRQYPISGIILFDVIEKESKFETPRKINYLTHLNSVIHYRGQNNYTVIRHEEVNVAPKVSNETSWFSTIVLLISVVVVIFVFIWKRNQLKDWILGKPSNE